ncbi:hypothetical protein BDV36DRAFT_271694 [Aspergillus pseudocaelatus]|uniref:Uncharacterized protein n=1 Tax=Aspergillus pseudocaelatus TaxID=1825620 RepID=A0ABQ6WAA9_9EURO|nr:hypothetical protein BDV36DRAFT_271694 [Aspergillus pseudocaelatus]
MLKEGLINAKVAAMSRVSERVATENKIFKHENKALPETIKLQKRKRKARKAMGLFNPEENGGQPVFFFFFFFCFLVQPKLNLLSSAWEIRNRRWSSISKRLKIVCCNLPSYAKKRLGN